MMTLMRAARLALVAVLGAAACCLAQGAPATANSTPSKMPVYDVATIKTNTTGSGNTSVNTRLATLIASNWALKDMLQDAFGIRRNLIYGLQGWAENAHYDINAKVLDPDAAQLKKLTPKQRRDMVRTLCEDRFGLKWHVETRILPTYELVVTKEGSKLTLSTKNDDDSGASQNNTDLTVTNIQLSEFTNMLSQELEKPVVDRSGLPGRYDFKLRWTREQSGSPADAGQDPNAPPPLFTAIQEQLGLKLQPGKDPVQVLVIDSMSPPSEN